ncbi:MAG: DUF3618 domain-containing protein [Actinobacteria bacterium]|nr:DUF3618 domain-containing protein [Actinomycetota bacterium]
MNEIPERIEREMFEIRSRMAPDVRDLRKHTEPQVIGKQVGNRIKERVKGAAIGLGKSILASARRQVGAIGEAGRKGDPSRFTDAVKSDPRPLILLAVSLALTLMMARRITTGRE